MNAPRATGSRLTRALFGLSDFLASLALVLAVLGMTLAPLVLTQPRLDGTVPLTQSAALLVAADCALLALGAWLAGRRRLAGIPVLVLSAAWALLFSAGGIFWIALGLAVAFALPMLRAWHGMSCMRVTD